MTIMAGQFGNITTSAPKGVYHPVARVTGVADGTLELEGLPQYLTGTPELVLFRDESGHELLVDMRIGSFDPRLSAYQLLCAVQDAPAGSVLSLQCGRHHRDDNIRDRFPYVGLRADLSMRVLHLNCCTISLYPILNQP